MNLTSAIWFTIALTILTLLYLRGRALGVQFVVQLAAFAIIGALLIPVVKSMIYPVFPADAGALTHRIFVAVWWLLAARLIVLIGRFAYDRREGASRLAFDLGSAAVNTAVVLVTFNLVFDISVFSLVATSGIIAIVLGLALQSTLGDLFSGIAISVEEPFGIGDYIWIDGAMEGSVIETNWRATRLVTDSNDIATIPNSVVAKARILNRSRLTEIRTDTFRIVLEPAILPQLGIELIEAAILATPGVDSVPPSFVNCVELRGEGISYDVHFSAPRRILGTVRSAILHRIARNTHYAGVAFGMQSGGAIRTATAPDAIQLLRDTNLFSALSGDDLSALASKLVIRRGDPGEFLFQQGGAVASLFIVVQGVLEAVVADGQAETRIGTIAAGDHLGELSLLTGASNPATVRALTRFEVYEITKPSLALVMQDHPHVLNAIERSAASSLAKLEEHTAAKHLDAGPVHLIDRIRSFFEPPSVR